ncbi:MAG: hypothetical protein WDO73_31320 [Ignavibacteriota bacterium]
MKTALFIGLGIVTLGYVLVWFRLARNARHGTGTPTPLDIAIGFFANFLDTLGGRIVRHHELALQARRPGAR